MSMTRNRNGMKWIEHGTHLVGQNQSSLTSCLTSQLPSRLAFPHFNKFVVHVAFKIASRMPGKALCLCILRPVAFATLRFALVPKPSQLTWECGRDVSVTECHPGWSPGAVVTKTCSAKPSAHQSLLSKSRQAASGV